MCGVKSGDEFSDEAVDESGLEQEALPAQLDGPRVRPPSVVGPFGIEGRYLVRSAGREKSVWDVGQQQVEYVHGRRFVAAKPGEELVEPYRPLCQCIAQLLDALREREGRILPRLIQ